MTRTVIWETPENREEYADTPCELKRLLWGDTCGLLPRQHGGPPFHAWRIYRDIPTASPVAPERCDTCGDVHSKQVACFTAPPTTDAEPAPGSTAFDSTNSSIVCIRVSLSDRALLRAAAGQVGMSVTAWLEDELRCAAMRVVEQGKK